MPPASQDLTRYQAVEEEYRSALGDYEAELAVYQAMLQRDPKDPDLPKRYELVEEKNRQVRGIYKKLEELRRTLGATSRAS